MLYIYWLIWVIQLIFMTYSHYAEKPNVLRFLAHIMIIRNIMPWFNLGQRKAFNDTANLVHFSLFQNIVLICFLIVMGVCETYKIHIPTSIFYQFFMGYGQIASFYQKDGVKNHLKFVIQNKLSLVIIHTFLHLACQYIVSMSIIYLMDNNKLILN